MSKWRRMIHKRYMVWLVAVVVFFVMVATVYAVRPTISLNSSTSFPVDI